MSSGGGSEGGASQEWWDGVKQEAAALGRGEDHVLLLGKLELEYADTEEEDEPIPPTLEQLRALPVVICPRPARGHLEAVARELGMVGRDDEDDPIRMTNTSSSYEGHDIIARHLRKIDALLRKKDWPEAFTYALALLRAASEDSFWFAHTDVPEVVVELVKKMDKQWDKLWARSEEELGGVAAADRGKVEALRADFKAEAREYGCLESD